MDALVRRDRRWRSGRASCSRGPGRAAVSALLAAGHPREFRANRLRSGLEYCGVHQQVVGFRSAATGGQRNAFDSFSGDPQCRRHLPAGNSRRRLPPQGNSDLAAHGGSHAGARNGYLDGGRAAQTVCAIAGTLQGANFAARDLRDAVPAWSWGLLVASQHCGCSAADAGHGNVNRDPYGRWSDTLRILGVGSADVLPVDSARKGSCRAGAATGDHRMSTARTTELTLSARANGYIALTKPDVSFLVLMTTAAGYYMGA